MTTFQRNTNYEVFKEVPQVWDAGLGPTANKAGAGGGNVTPPTPGQTRITEASDRRITEAGDVRITE